MELPFAEQVRRRPGMYIGGVDTQGLHHLVWEIVGNVVDLHLSQMVTTLHVDIVDGWVTVRDDGPGIPPAVLAEAFTTCHSSATYDGHFPHVHLTPDLHGLGLAVVTALSSQLDVDTTYNAIRYRRAFSRGVEKSALRTGGTAREGTSIRFRPDFEFFNRALDLQAIHERLQELAWLNPMLRVFFQGERLFWRGGVAGWAHDLATARGGASKRGFAARSSVEHTSVDLALVWTTRRRAPDIRSYVNMQRSKSGAHVDGLWTGLLEYATSLGKKRLSTDEIRERFSFGMIAVLSVGLHSPSFLGPTRDHLHSPEAGTAVARTITSELPAIAARNSHLREFLAARLAG